LQLLLRCGCKVTASIRDDNDDSAAHSTPTQKLCLLLKVWLFGSVDGNGPSRKVAGHVNGMRDCTSMCCAFRASEHGLQALGWALAYQDHVIRLPGRGHFSPAHPDEVRRAKSARSDARFWPAVQEGLAMQPKA